MVQWLELGAGSISDWGTKMSQVMQPQAKKKKSLVNQNKLSNFLQESIFKNPYKKGLSESV